MHNVDALAPERWLVCSALAYGSITGHWLNEAGPRSLLSWRVAHGLVEKVDRESLLGRLAELVDDQHGSVSVLFDEIDDDAADLLDSVSQTTAEELDLKVIEWRSAPLDAVVSINSPDRALLRKLQGDIDVEDLKSFAGSKSLPAVADLSGYIAALSDWERNCREAFAASFAENYPRFSKGNVPWNALLSNQATGAQFTASAANDNSWIPLSALRAGTSPDPSVPFRLDSPAGTAEQWNITWAPIEGGPSGFLIFTCHPVSISGMIGCRVEVKAGDEILDLGPVLEDGIAEIKLERLVDLGNLSVKISRPQD
jgi:hypothetical protein